MGLTDEEKPASRSSVVLEHGEKTYPEEHEIAPKEQEIDPQTKARWETFTSDSPPRDDLEMPLDFSRNREPLQNAQVQPEAAQPGLPQESPVSVQTAQAPVETPQMPAQPELPRTELPPVDEPRPVKLKPKTHSTDDIMALELQNLKTQHELILEKLKNIEDLLRKG